MKHVVLIKHAPSPIMATGVKFSVSME